MRRIVAATIAVWLVVVAGAIVSVLLSGPVVVNVPAGTAVDRMIRNAPEGAILRLEAGSYAPFTIARTIAVEGTSGAVVRGPVTVLADGVRIEDLAVTGGDSGIVVRDADGVELERIAVRGAHLHGIEVAPGSVVIRDCRIEALASPYAQAIEIRNSSGRPRSIVEGCSVSSGQEGLVSHVSRVEFRDNVVRHTTLRAIVVTEMSEGLAAANEVVDVRGIGLYCGDESHCEFADNAVEGVSGAPSAGQSHAGYGAVALYKSTMRLRQNTFRDTAAGEPVGLFLEGRITDRFPLAVWPPGWKGALPAIHVSALSVMGLGLVAAAAYPFVARRRRNGRSDARVPPERRAVRMLAIGFAIQSFHMLEHYAQVYQTYVAQAQNRHGLAGSAVDIEWVHFVYNSAVLVFLVSALIVLWDWLRPIPAAILAATVLVQAYHVVEHTAKIVQHVGLKIDPAPGLLGGHVGLVWFHFGINLAVYVGTAVALGSVVWTSIRARGVRDRGAFLSGAPAAA